jgi:Holliday junction DNA helicase RuvA
MMLSSMSSDEITNAIQTENINKIKSIKGIGLKSAHRLIIELKDKVGKISGETPTLPGLASNTAMEEATTALVMLGFAKPNVNKVLSAIVKEKPDMSLEEMIKIALKKL